MGRTTGRSFPRSRTMQRGMTAIQVTARLQAASPRRRSRSPSLRYDTHKMPSGLLEIATQWAGRSGAGSTAGRPETSGQALASAPNALIAWTNLIQKPTFNPGLKTQLSGIGLGVAEASVYAVKVDPQVDIDSLAGYRFLSAIQNTALAWEFVLFAGNWTLYRCVDYGEPRGPAQLYLPMAISTNREKLQRFKDELLAADFKIEVWRTLKGTVPWPTQPAISPRYPTFRQG